MWAVASTLPKQPRNLKEVVATPACPHLYLNRLFLFSLWQHPVSNTLQTPLPVLTCT
jgi:hypothetical protein